MHAKLPKPTGGAPAAVDDRAFTMKPWSEAAAHQHAGIAWPLGCD